MGDSLADHRHLIGTMLESEFQIENSGQGRSSRSLDLHHRASGLWTLRRADFEARASEGSRRAKLGLQEDGKKLVTTLWVDRHVLRGTGNTDGTRFEVLLVHADGSGPGHSDRLRLIGNLDRGEISGSFDNGDDRGSWTAWKE